MIVHAQSPEHEYHLASHLAARIGIDVRDLVGDMPYHAIGIVRGDKLLGVVLFMNYRRQSIEVHLCGAPGWLSRGEIGELFAYPFERLGCLRLWCLIARNNKQARKGAERLGFKVLGVAQDEFGEGKDGIVYSMRRRDCKWLA